jgi:hypothetical protein
LCDDRGREMLGEALTLPSVDRVRALSWRVVARGLFAVRVPAATAPTKFDLPSARL